MCGLQREGGSLRGGWEPCGNPQRQGSRLAADCFSSLQIHSQPIEIPGISSHNSHLCNCQLDLIIIYYAKLNFFEA